MTDQHKGGYQGGSGRGGNSRAPRQGGFDKRSGGNRGERRYDRSEGGYRKDGKGGSYGGPKRDGKPYGDRKPGGKPYGGRDGKPYGKPGSKPYGNRDGKPYGERDRKPYGSRDGKPYGDRKPGGKSYGSLARASAEALLAAASRSRNTTAASAGLALPPRAVSTASVTVRSTAANSTMPNVA